MEDWVHALHRRVPNFRKSQYVSGESSENVVLSFEHVGGMEDVKRRIREVLKKNNI